MTKKVKFNVHGSYHNIPDEKIREIKAKCDELEMSDIKQLQAYRDAMSSRFGFKTYKPDDIVDVPNWYFEACKDQTTVSPVSFNTYKDKSGLPMMYDVDEAVRHGQIKEENRNTLIKEMKLFDFIQDNDEEARKPGRPKVETETK